MPAVTPALAPSLKVPLLCTTEWGANGMVRNGQASVAGNLQRPKLTALWGAGLSFSKCHAEKTVRYDPHLPQIFDGEEFSRAARLWTHGYDVYTPSVNAVFHNYTGGGSAAWTSNPPRGDGAAAVQQR